MRNAMSALSRLGRAGCLAALLLGPGCASHPQGAAPTATGGQITGIAVSGTDVYVAGIATATYGALPASGQVQTVPATLVSESGYWKNGAWVPLVGSAGQVTALAASETGVWVAGFGPSGPGIWANGAWSGLPLPEGVKTVNLGALVVSGSDVYLAGTLDYGNGTYLQDVSVPGYWVNSLWKGLTLPPGLVAGHALGLALFGSDVRVAGLCDDGVAFDPKVAGYWLNGTWVGLPSPGPDGIAGALTVSVSGGHCYVADLGDIWLGYWLDGLWQTLQLPANSLGGGISGFLVTPGHVFVSGFSDPVLGTIAPGYWMDGSWVALSQPVNMGGVSPGAMATNGNDIYITGSGQNSAKPQTLELGYWVNGNWIGLPTPVPGPGA